MVCSRLHNMRFSFSIQFELQVIRKGCITITTNTKPLAIRDFVEGGIRLSGKVHGIFLFCPRYRD